MRRRDYQYIDEEFCREIEKQIEDEEYADMMCKETAEEKEKENAEILLPLL